MSVYVDDAMIVRKLHRWPGKWSHLVADSIEELHEFAAKIGMERKWFQDKRIPHYDLTKQRRDAAIAAGAIPLSKRELVRRFRPLANKQSPTEEE